MALRMYRDPLGDEWRVWRVVPETVSFASLDESYREGWLCFERLDGSDRRRLSMMKVPSGWDSLSDAQLDQLRRTADPAARRSTATGVLADRAETGTAARDKRGD